jgi:hypothetical protein
MGKAQEKQTRLRVSERLVFLFDVDFTSVALETWVTWTSRRSRLECSRSEQYDQALSYVLFCHGATGDRRHAEGQEHMQVLW